MQVMFSGAGFLPAPIFLCARQGSLTAGNAQETLDIKVKLNDYKIFTFVDRRCRGQLRSS
jgi:hypothetical protein